MGSIRIDSYDPTDMSLLSSDVTGVNFGNVVKGQHSANVVTIRPVFVDGGMSLTALALFLEDTHGVNHTQFGKLKSDTAITGIEPGSDYLSDHFTPITGISDASMIGVYSDYGVLYTNMTDPEYTWMDAEAGMSETMIGADTVNFRFVFEYS